MTLARKIEIALEEQDSSDTFGDNFLQEDGTWGGTCKLNTWVTEMTLIYVAGSRQDGHLIFQVKGDDPHNFYKLTHYESPQRAMWLAAVDVVVPRTVTVYDVT